MLVQLTVFLLPVAAACGWYVAKKENNAEKGRESVKLHHDYFKGLNYLINEQPDKAVDVFIKLLEVDSDTVETHLALGNLFRRRGEVDRSIRIHQNLIARPQLKQQYKVQAMSALGQDYLRAGVLDRAEELFLELVELGEIDQTNLKFLLDIYQQEKDWEKAINIAKKLEHVSGNTMNPTIAHYYCEIAELMIEKNNHESALDNLDSAQKIDPDCVRASLVRGRIEMHKQNYDEAIKCYKKVKKQNSDFISEIVSPLLRCYHALNEDEKLVAYLNECLRDHQRFSFVSAISEYLKHKVGDKAAIEFIASQIQRQPSMRGLRHLVELYLVNSKGDAKEKLTILQSLMDKLLENKPIYRCFHCGFSGRMLYWLCPSCQHWTTVKPILGLEGN